MAKFWGFDDLNVFQSNLKCINEIDASKYKYEPSIWWDKLRFMVNLFLEGQSLAT